MALKELGDLVVGYSTILAPAPSEPAALAIFIEDSMSTTPLRASVAVLRPVLDSDVIVGCASPFAFPSGIIRTTLQLTDGYLGQYVHSYREEFLPSDGFSTFIEAGKSTSTTRSIMMLPSRIHLLNRQVVVETLMVDESAFATLLGDFVLNISIAGTLLKVGLYVIRGDACVQRPVPQGVLWQAAEAGDDTRVGEALIGGCTTEEFDPDGVTALQVAALRGRVRVVRMLLAAGALVTARDNAGRTALHRASYWRVPEHVHVVAALLDHPGVDPCAIDISGYTPLHLAAQTGSAEIVKRLLSLDVINVNAVDNTQHTPLDWATLNEHHAVVALLRADPRVDQTLQATRCGLEAQLEEEPAEEEFMLPEGPEYDAYYAVLTRGVWS